MTTKWLSDYCLTTSWRVPYDWLPDDYLRTVLTVNYHYIMAAWHATKLLEPKKHSPMTKELLTRESSNMVSPSLSSGKILTVNSWLGMFSCSWIISSWRICCILIQIISAKSSHHFWIVSRLLVNGAPLPDNCWSRFHRFNSWSSIRNCNSLSCLITSRWWLAKFDVCNFKLLNWKIVMKSEMNYILGKVKPKKQMS